MKLIDIGEYMLPEGVTIKRNGKILRVVACKDNKVTEYRCRDCEHRQYGYTRKIGLYMSPVCIKKPKNGKTVNGVQIYFRCDPYGKICDEFKLKTN